jgi:hypothetical protein
MKLSIDFETRSLADLPIGRELGDMFNRFDLGEDFECVPCDGRRLLRVEYPDWWAQMAATGHRFGGDAEGSNVPDCRFTPTSETSYRIRVLPYKK